MKKIAITLTALLAAASAFAQGTFNFTTRVTGSVNAPVVYEATGENVGNMFWGQLLAGAPGSDLAPIGAPVEFRNDAGIGYITAGGTVSVPGVAGGSPADVQLVAWHKDLGDTWAAAETANLGGIGASDVITVNTGGAGDPAGPPTLLTTLEGFEVSTLIPEPSIAALGLLGAGLLLIRRKK